MADRESCWWFVTSHQANIHIPGSHPGCKNPSENIVVFYKNGCKLVSYRAMQWLFLTTRYQTNYLVSFCSIPMNNSSEWRASFAVFYFLLGESWKSPFVSRKGSFFFYLAVVKIPMCHFWFRGKQNIFDRLEWRQVNDLLQLPILNARPELPALQYFIAPNHYLYISQLGQCAKLVKLVRHD